MTQLSNSANLQYLNLINHYLQKGHDRAAERLTEGCRPEPKYRLKMGLEYTLLYDQPKATIRCVANVCLRNGYLLIRKRFYYRDVLAPHRTAQSLNICGLTKRCEMGGETEANVSGWTVDTLHDSIMQLYRERDVRYENRFVAQEKALDTALVSAKEAVSAALISAKDAVQAALAATREAIMKSDASTETRFHAVNEFRASLNDLTGTMMPRHETNAALNNLTDKIDEVKATTTERNGIIMGRLDHIEGKNMGTEKSLAVTLGSGAIVVSLIVGAITFWSSRSSPTLVSTPSSISSTAAAVTDAATNARLDAINAKIDAAIAKLVK